jgi:hypothetical protein
MNLGFYARGPVVLPHPPYPKATLRLVEQAIAEAWRIIRDTPEGDFDITRHEEDRITRELRTCLMNRVLDGGLVKGFTSDQFGIQREPKFESFDGTHLDKMPDLYIVIIRDNPSLVSLPANDGLFVECKPVGKAHPAGSAYCDKGVARFVKGEYAWAMPHALMIGYADSKYTIPRKLKEALRDRMTELNTNGNVTKCRCLSPGMYTQHPHESRHRRGFTYPQTNTIAPDILLRHLWLDRN